MIKVSVIIPVYNSERYIEKCIRSVMNQSLQNLEIIAIDDGSGDRTGIILDQIQKEDKRLKVVHQTNQGVSASRNLGISMAAGEYITFVDGDDYIGPDYLKELVEGAERNQAELVICGLTRVDETGKIINQLKPGKYYRFKKEEWTFRISCAASHLYKRELWEQYNVRFGLGVRGEDMPISLFFSAMCDKIVTIPCTEYFYVQHPGSAMHQFGGLRHYRLPYREIEEVIRKVHEYGIRNSKDFFELFVLRILATNISFAHGASAEDKAEMQKFTSHILQQYFPNYWKNKKAGIFSKVEIPLGQKIAVKALIIMVKFHLLPVFFKIL